MNYLVHLKARNDKLFNNVERSPLDMLDMARKEARDWFVVNYLEGETHASPLDEELTITQPVTFTYYIDGSWKDGE